MSDYKVQLDVFEGPLDLLLYLIKKDEVDIYNIPISRITTQYMEHLDLIKMLVPEVAGEFVVMGATLMYIKSRMLLPDDQQAVDPEAEGEEMDPRWDLVRQLIEYKKFKDAAGFLHQREEFQEKLFVHNPLSSQDNRPPAAPSDLAGITTFDLLGAFNQLLKRLQAATPSREITEDQFTVADKMDVILKLMESAEEIHFEKLFEGAASRMEMIVTFLAMLELIRLRKIRAGQSQAFGEIRVRRAVPVEETSSVSGPNPPQADPSPETSPAPPPSEV